MTTFDAVILAGGRARRLDGADKATLVLGESSLLDRALRAVEPAQTTIVVGPERPTGREVVWTREDPAGSGPAAALAAGLEHVGAELVVVLAVDHPFVTHREIERLVAAVAEDGAILRDERARDQPLVGAYRSEVLKNAVARLGWIEDAAVRELVEGLLLTRVDGGLSALDCDTWDDVAAARAAEEGV